MNARDFEIGRAVLYVPYHAHGNQGHPDVERGIVTSANDDTVFVRFDGDINGKGCYPDTLVYETPV